MTGPDKAVLAELDIVGSGVAQSPALVGRLERLPKWVNLIPMVAQWIWLSIRYGSWSLPAAANPQITAGGLVGEGKSEYFRSMGPLARAHTAAYAVLRNSGSVSGAEKCMTDAGLILAGAGLASGS